MCQDEDIDRYANDPRLLVDLCRKVIQRVESGLNDPKVKEREYQLREISTSVEKLERMGVAVPEALRAEKTRLAAKLDVQGEADQSLQVLAEGLNAITKDLNLKLGKDDQRAGSKKRQPRTKRSRSPKTDKEVLRQYIIQALESLGGRAKVAEVIAEMGCQLDGNLLQGDLEWRESTGEYAWQNNAKWERYRMTQDGILRDDSPRGYWELKEGQP